jgi:endonuclease-3
LIAVVLSAQTTDVQVNKVMSKLFKKYSNIDDILRLGLEGLTQEIRSIGLYRNKAKNIIALSEILKAKFDSKVPNSREDLESLPGVGRKTANVVMNSLFDKPTIAVDTHVLRLSKRLGFSQSGDPLKVEADLERIIPAAYKKSISNLLVLHGRYVCKAKKPDCQNCVLFDLCDRVE